jgi:hypothetical protein
MSLHRKEMEKVLCLSFLTGTPHYELSKNGENNNLGDAQSTPLDLLNSWFANV